MTHSAENDALFVVWQQVVRERMARAFDEGWNACYEYLGVADYDGPDDVPNPYEEARVIPPGQETPEEVHLEGYDCWCRPLVDLDAWEILHRRSDPSPP